MKYRLRIVTDWATELGTPVLQCCKPAGHGHRIRYRACYHHDDVAGLGVLTKGSMAVRGVGFKSWADGLRRPALIDRVGGEIFGRVWLQENGSIARAVAFELYCAHNDRFRTLLTQAAALPLAGADPASASVEYEYSVAGPISSQLLGRLL